MKAAQDVIASLAGWLAKWGRGLPAEAWTELLRSLGLGDESADRIQQVGELLCYTPIGLAYALGLVVDGDAASLRSARTRLERWRRTGTGPRHIKLGRAVSAPIFYPVEGVIRWLAAESAEAKGLDRVNLRRRPPASLLAKEAA